MKTIHEWFLTLDEPQKTLALYYLSKRTSNWETGSLSSALAHGFNWYETVEGYNYWDEKYFKIKLIEKNEL